MDNLTNSGKVDVLLIEDNPADVRMIYEIFKEFDLEVGLHVIDNGIEALKFLNKEEKYENIVDPNLILLDLNLHLITGFEVLEKIKNNDNLKDIPVLVLTTSVNKEDFLKVQKLQGDCFIIKPLCYEEYSTILQHIGKCWL